MTLKQKIHNHYLQVINDRIYTLQQVLADLKESSTNETKSTAGDKHETALAMLQIEQANSRGQLNVLLEKQASLKKINPLLTADTAGMGSLIKTDQGYLFLSIAMGKITVDSVGVTALSPQSPLGAKLPGVKAGDIVEMNNLFYVIESVC